MSTINIELEEAIMNAWQTENDIQSVYDGSDVDYTKPDNVDKLQNQLIGLKEFHSLRMNKLWDTFEKMLAEQRADRQQQKNV